MAGHVEKRHLKLPEVDKLLLDGCVLWKWDDGESNPQKLTFKADKDGYFLSARGEDPTKVYESYVWDLQLVSDVRPGKVPKDSRLLENLLSLTGSENLDGFSITLVYRRDGITNLDYINLVCEWPKTAESFKTAVNSLTGCMLHAHAAPVVLYRKNYTKILLHGDAQGRIPLKFIIKMMITRQAASTSIIQFLSGFNIVISSEEKGAEKYVKAESFTWDIYMRLIDQLLNNRTGDLDLIIPSVSTKKVSLIQKVKIELGDFQRFLNYEQRDPRLNEILHPPVGRAQAKQMMEKLEGGKVLTARGLLDYLMGEDNNVLDLASLDQYMDMNKPLNHYFVNSSHNTYLNGHQLKSQSLSEMYIQTLLKGCRCLELDCWPTGGGDTEDITITHGGTLCTKVTFKECVEAINEFAFVKSEYPVILSIENHCKSRATLIQKMANIFTSTFGDKLMKEPFDDLPLEPGVPLPPLERLKGKILLKDKVKRKKDVSEGGTLPRNTHGVMLPMDSIDQPTTTAAAVTNCEKIEEVGGATEANGTKEATPTPEKPLGEKGGGGGVGDGDARGGGGGGGGGGEKEGTNEVEEKRRQFRKGSIEPSEVEYTKGRKMSGLDIVTTPTNLMSPASTLRRGEHMDGEMQPLRWHETEAMVSGPLKELLNYTTGITFEGFAAAEKLNCSFYMSSFVEDKGQNFIKTQARDFVKYTQRQNSRVYPNGSRINSSNYMPQIFWNVGCQMIALNYQTSDLPVQLNQAKYEFNGGTGFIRKPWVMMREGGSSGLFNPFTQSKLEDIVPAKLSIKIISGSFLTDKRTNCLVEAEMYGLPADTVRHKYTKKAPAPHPFWNENPFTSKRILLPELATLRIAVFDDDRELVGQRCLPVNHIRPGFRYIPLRDKHNQPLPLAMLFVNIKVEDWVPNEMEDVVAMLMDPISFATKALEELAKGDELDDLDDNGAPETTDNATPGQGGGRGGDGVDWNPSPAPKMTPRDPEPQAKSSSSASPAPPSLTPQSQAAPSSSTTAAASAIPSVPSSAAMSDFPDTLPSYDRAKERVPRSIPFESAAVTEQKEYVKMVKRHSKQKLSITKGHEKAVNTLQTRLQKSKVDPEASPDMEAMKTQQTGELFTFDHTALLERHKVQKTSLELAQAVQMKNLEKVHKSDLEAMHKDMGILVKKHSITLQQTTDKKTRGITKKDFEERAIVFGRKQRGEFAKLHDAERAKMAECQEIERKRLLDTQAKELLEAQAGQSSNL